MTDMKMTKIFMETEGRELKQQANRARTINEAFTSDGRIREDVLSTSLPWQRVDFNMHGAAVVDGRLGGIYELPQGGRIRRISGFARIAPSTGPFTYRLAVNGTVIDSGSIQPGLDTLSPSGMNTVVAPGGVLTLNVTSGGDAEDVTISVFYSAGGLA